MLELFKLTKAYTEANDRTEADALKGFELSDEEFNLVAGGIYEAPGD